MARPRSADHHLKRDEILDAAALCFAQLSYPAASMQEVAARLGTSKARIYHYYEAKDALLFDLLDRYTQRLLALIGETDALAQRRQLNDRAALHALIEAFLIEYESSATRHVALLNDTKFLSDALLDGGKLSQRQIILQRQRDIVSAFTRFVRRAYPERLNDGNQTALTMMLMGMINWTFTWLRPGGAISYADFAQEVIATLESGFRA
ncbi:MAG: TetR/AcrR family transcriptional regulator [Brachymonas sp.]|nr:TetR/AcrR family transcriptional regulator [Brachymonas sp.]